MALVVEPHGDDLDRLARGEQRHVLEGNRLSGGLGQIEQVAAQLPDRLPVQDAVGGLASDGITDVLRDLGLGRDRAGKTERADRPQA